jgi:polysaccharide pyruvyl transferase WcaK-like protein
VNPHRRERSRIAFWGNFGTHNLGNECTLHAALDAARRHAARAELFAVCNGPADTSARHQVDAVQIAPPLSTARLPHGRAIRVARRLAAELRDWPRVVKTMRRTDRLVMTGTGMLTDLHQGPLGTPYQMLKWAAAARWCGKEVFFLSVGVEQLLQPATVNMMGRALRLARYRSYRDPASRMRAARLLKASSEDPLFPDLAFSLPESLTTGQGSPPAGAPTVAVGLYAVESRAMPAYLAVLGTFVLRLLDGGYRVRLVIGDARYDQGAREGMEGWLRARGADKRVLDDPAASFQDLMGQLARVDFVVATRYHNLILAFLLDKPAVSISHMDKDDELMAAMGLSAYCLPLNEIEADRLLETFSRMERHAGEVRQNIRRRVQICRERLEEQYALVFGESDQGTGEHS